MNYKINDSHTDPFYIGFFSVVDFPVSQQFQFDPCSIRKRKPVVIDGFYRIRFDLFHGFFHRINGDGNVVISVLCLCVDVGNFAELDTFPEPAFALRFLPNFPPHMHVKNILKKFLCIFIGRSTDRCMIDLCHKNCASFIYDVYAIFYLL